MTSGLAITLLLGAAIIAWILLRPALAARLRGQLRRLGLDAAQQALLRRRWPLYRQLPAALRRRLDQLVSVFLGEKEFVGCRGLAITPAMKLWIAAQACLLVLGRDRHVYDRLRAVLVYPRQFVVPESWHGEDGVVTEEERVLSGQAWDVSRIILSWEDVEAGSADEVYNVVIHEFAHYLDHEHGSAWLGDAAARQRWTEVLEREYAALRAAVGRGEPSFLDPYAAEDPAEFFAVACEAFVEAPRQLRQHHPALYRELSGFYRLDPAGW